MTLTSHLVKLAHENTQPALSTSAPAASAPPPPASENTRPPASQATRLIDLAHAAGAQAWHDPAGDPYLTLPVGGHREHHALASRAVKDWLARAYHRETQNVPGSQALADAVSVLGGHARFEGPEYQTAVRVGGDGCDDVFLDLVDPAWRAVHVTARGWRVEDNPPTHFIRSRGMLPLPEPTRGGSLAPLRELLHLGASDDGVFRLLVGWIVGALCPTGPYPLLALSGEQGTGKSTSARLIRRCIDPHIAELRSEPHSIEDVMIAAVRSRVIAFDNLSRMEPWLSDALCCLATGGAMTRRELFTNSDESIVSATRPTVITSINDVVTRGDLLDRAIVVTLPLLPEGERLPEAAVWQRFNATAPGILGALLDGVVSALARRRAVSLKHLPRMADLIVWTTAAEPGLGWPEGSILTAYNAMRDSTEAATLDGDVLAVALRALPHPWTGTASDLLTRLTPQGRLPRGWPESPRGMSSALRRLAPALRRVGILVEFRQEHGSNARRLIDIRPALEDGGTAPSQPTQPAPATQRHVEPSVRRCDASDDCDGLPGLLPDGHERGTA